TGLGTVAVLDEELPVLPDEEVEVVLFRRVQVLPTDEEAVRLRVARGLALREARPCTILARGDVVRRVEDAGWARRHMEVAFHEVEVDLVERSVRPVESGEPPCRERALDVRVLGVLTGRPMIRMLCGE